MGSGRGCHGDGGTHDVWCGLVWCGEEAVEVLASVGSRTDSLVERSTCALCDLANCAAVKGRRNGEWGERVLTAVRCWLRKCREMNESSATKQNELLSALGMESEDCGYSVAGMSEVRCAGGRNGRVGMLVCWYAVMRGN